VQKLLVFPDNSYSYRIRIIVNGCYWRLGVMQTRVYYRVFQNKLHEVCRVINIEPFVLG